MILLEQTVIDIAKANFEEALAHLIKSYESEPGSLESKGAMIQAVKKTFAADNALDQISLAVGVSGDNGLTYDKLEKVAKRYSTGKNSLSYFDEVFGRDLGDLQIDLFNTLSKIASQIEATT